MPNNIRAVPVIDTSASMTYGDYVSITVIDSKAFVEQALPGDTIGVVNYDVNGYTAYPFTTVDQNPVGVRQAAADAIDNLVFNGSCTNMGGGIEQARSMLDPAEDPRGLVLLSDGYQNCGTNPLSVLPDSYPIYSCAMGPDSDQTLMQQIADGTPEGQYYYAPYVNTMMMIYNEIRDNSERTQVALNEARRVTPMNYLYLPVSVSEDDSVGQFAVVWDNTAYTYTSGIPTSSTLSITLVDPSGSLWSGSPQIIGAGYVVFNIPEPLIGQWYVQVEYGGQTESLGVTAGVFEINVIDGEAAVRMEVEAPRTVKAGEPLAFQARVTDRGEPLSDLEVHAEIAQPHLGVPAALSLYRELLAGVTLPSQDVGGPMPEELLRLRALRRAHLPRVDLLPTRRYPLTLEANGDHYRAAVRDTSQVGTYNLHIRASGRSRRTGRRFQRCRLVSVRVE